MDADADLDSAVEGVAQSAFGFQGQKCSACSRAIVDERIYDKFLEQLKVRVEKITVGDPAENANMGAVINEGSMKTILEYIEQGKKDGRLITGGNSRPLTRAKDISSSPPSSPISHRNRNSSRKKSSARCWLSSKSRNYDHALEIANDTEFGLTGAVYTKSKEKIARAIREFHVGNLYINRKCTGAMVGAHPFGGFNMSGTDSKVRRARLLVFVYPRQSGRRKNRLGNVGASVLARAELVRAVQAGAYELGTLAITP